jgi:hypothetical protein
MLFSRLPWQASHLRCDAQGRRRVFAPTVPWAPIANALSPQSVSIGRRRQCLDKNKMAVTQFVRAAKIPSKKSAAGATSWLLPADITDARRSRFIFSLCHPENDVCVIVSTLEFPTMPS